MAVINVNLFSMNLLHDMDVTVILPDKIEYFSRKEENYAYF